uniref:chitin synthase n=1 Tax=Gadus morhua TaxID=8049 RepID=A0A8C5FK43_GADMO
SFLLLITVAGPTGHSVPPENKALVLLAIWGTLVAPSLLLMIKNIWKAVFFGSKLPSEHTVVSMEFLVSGGAAVLALAAMPHLDIVTNMTILNSVAVFSSLFQVASRSHARLCNSWIVAPVFSVLLILAGHTLFLALYLMDAEGRREAALRCGLAVGATVLVSLTWWQNYLPHLLLPRHAWLTEEMQRCAVVVHLLTSFTRLAVTACVLAAYVPLSGGAWSSVWAPVAPAVGRLLATLAGLQLLSSVVGHWLSLAACKMNALRRCFLLPLYLASLALLPLFLAQSSETRAPANPALCPGAAVCWWVGFLLATAHTWALRLQRIQTTKQLFVRRMYEGAWLEQGLLLNARFNMVPEEKLTLYMCATMWHETFSEMEKIIISIFRWDQFRPHDDREVNNLTTEAHIFFDDAFRTVPVSGERHANQYVEDMVQVIQKVYSPFMGPGPIGDQILLRTPYGGRLNVTLPCGNLLVVHLKDKSLIRHKKRWSQIMYMYYLLGWRLDTRFYRRWLNGEDQAQIEREKERKNTYILALDGDTDFHPPAVMLLIDRLKQYPDVGAACGRIHPTGTGPIVWYQKFEYALTHWLYKTAEHVLGCVLCSPGCFSLFRGAALMDVNIMKRYTTPPTEALHHIQYDQGEDRWLCTLMLQQGWRVEYNAASDAYTNAPEGFKEFYNQRRRWTPSTLANSIDLLGGSIRLARKNRSISRPYLLYEMFIVGSSILIPATVCLMVTGRPCVCMLSLLLAIDPNWALILATIPPAIYLGLCFYLKADTQVTLAAVLSVLYALIMMVTMLTVISFLVTDDTIFSPLAISFVTFVMVYVVAALLHPQEAHLIVYGLLYILAIPSAYLLLSIYSIVNMNNVSWGTREGAATAGAAVPPPPRNKMESGSLSAFSDRYVEEADNQMMFSSPLKHETQFWNDLTERYLKPFPDDEDKKRETIKSLRELRNMATFIYFFANLLWLVATFTLQLLKGALSIRIPKYDNSLTFTGDYILVEPVTFMFLFTFVLLVVLQFLTMLFHR